MAERRWGATLLAIVIVATGLSVQQASPAAAATVPAGFHGVSLQRFPTPEEIDRLDEADVGVVRFLISWQQTEPTPGVYNWTYTDAYLRAIGQTGAKALPFFGSFPDWLETDSTGDPMSTDEARDSWRDFVKALMDRYGPDGAFVAAVPYAARIRTWQIWNEPNLNGPWGGKADPDSYARMVEIASEVIRDRDPAAEVMLAGLAPALHSIRPWDFIRGLLETLEPQHYDTVAIHPYAEDQPGVNSQIFRMREAMEEMGAGETPLALTEFGWSSSSHRSVKALAGTPRRQARRLTKAYQTFSRRPGLHLSEALWFSLHDIRTSVQGCTFCTTSGLLKRGGRPKRAWFALERSIRRLEAPDDYSPEAAP